MNKYTKIKVQFCFLRDNIPSFKTGLLAIIFAVFLLVFSTIRSEATYRVFLKNGQVISGVDNFTKTQGKVKLSKSGIFFELQETSVIKIEKYDKSSVRLQRIREGAAIDRELPDYLKYDEKSAEQQQAEELSDTKKLQQLKNRYKSIITRLGKIDTLEKKSRELQKRAHQKWSPRKARIASQEKARVDRELENLRSEVPSLLEEKEKLEYQIKHF
jgi:hypothetical protein